MATITGLTAERMQEIIDSTIVDADVVGDNLILIKDDGSTIDAGSVRGTPASNLGKGAAFPAGATDGDLFVRTDQAGDPLYKFTDGAWAISAGGLQKVTTFPAGPSDGDAIIRTDLNGSPIFTYSPENGWEQTPRMGAVTVPSARVTRTSAQSIANNVHTAVSFNTERYDTDSLHDNSVNQTRLTIKTPGLYHLTASFEWEVNSSGTRQVEFLLNGTTYIGVERRPSDATAVISTTYRFAAGDYIEMVVWQNSGGALNLNLGGGQYSPEFAIAWLGGAGQTVDERGVPSASVRRNSVLSIPANVETSVPMLFVDKDTDSMFDSVNGRLVAKTPGRYHITAGQLYWSSNSTGYREVYLRKNGNLVAVSDWSSAASANYQQPFSVDLDLAAGDYITLSVWQNSGTSISLGLVDPNYHAQPSLQASMISSAKTVTPFARVYNSAAQSIPGTSVDTALTFDSEDSDNDGIHDMVTNNSRLVCRTAGVYMIHGKVRLVSSAGTKWLSLRKNGATPAIEVITDGGGGADTGIEVATLIELAVGDYVEFLIGQNTGGAINTVATLANGGAGTHFEMVKIGAPNIGVAVGSAQATVYTVATLPAATAFPNGRIVGVSDGVAGQQARMSMNGAWINLG